MRETGSEAPTETKSRESGGSQGSERSYGDRMAESRQEGPAGRPPEAAVPAASDGQVETERPHRTEDPAAPNDHAGTERSAEAGQPGDAERPREAEPPGQTERPAGAERPAEAERSYADRMAESQQVAEVDRRAESERPAEPAVETPVESAGPPASRLDRFLDRLRRNPEEPQEGAGDIEQDEGVDPGHSLEPEPALPEGAPPYRDASDRPVQPERLDVETVRQGQLGDCSLIASIDALAHRDPARIASLVTVRENGDIVVSAGSGEPLSPTLPNVDDPTQFAANAQGEIYANSADGSLLGPYIEKAYAREVGGYDKLNEGIWPKDALTFLSGAPAYQERTADMPDAHLDRVVGPECAAVAHGEERGEDDPLLSLAEDYDVVTEGPHAYAVRGVDAEGRIELHNPWGGQHPLPMSPQVFRQLFPVVSWCEVGKGEHSEG